MALVPPNAWRTLLASASEEWRATPFYRLNLKAPDPERIAQWARDPRPGDSTRGFDILRGVWRMAGERLAGVHATPWSAPSPSPHFTARLHAFAWMPDVAGLGVTAQVTIGDVITSWVETFGQWHASAWSPELVSERLLAWLCYGREAIERLDGDRRAAFLRSFARQARHLQYAVQDVRDPLARIRAGAALVAAGVSGIPDGDRLREQGEEVLEEACASQFLPDGGHASRSPATLLEAFAAFLIAEDSLSRQGLETPRLMLDVKPRMGAMLRFFRMSDGRLPNFNGGDDGVAGGLDAVLREVGPGRDFQYATQSGYQRLAAGDVTLLMDVGGAPNAAYGERAHAGALAFELSSGPDRIIVNVGSSRELLPEWRAAGRATNGHSTLVIDDALSATFVQRRAGRGGAHPIGPSIAHKRTEEDDGALIEAHHDGYRAPYGYLHRRRVFLASDGRQLWGQDAAAPPLAGGRTSIKPEPFAVRFHLHPTVRVNQNDNRSLTLTPPNGPAWTFATDARRVELEASIYLGGREGPQRSRQIVLYGVTDPEKPEDKPPNLVKWKLSRVA